MIKEKYIDMIKSRVDIHQLVTQLCPNTHLQKAGLHRMKCRCVFHNEDTPSLMLDTSLNRYKCFGCGKGGDVIQFVMESQGYDFTESVRFLLDMYCHDADIHDIFEKTSPEHEEENRLKETMYIYNKYAYEFFRSQYDEISEESLICKSYA